jgi:acyl-CoA thioesterase-2
MMDIKKGPKLIGACEPLSGTDALSNLFALDADETGRRNRQCMLNIAGQVLGGHLAAHCVTAAAESGDGLEPGALHVLFVSGADPRQHYHVETEALRTGRRIAHRNMRLTQHGKVLVEASAILQARPVDASSQFRFHPAMPPVPYPEDLTPRALRPDEQNRLNIEMMESYPFLEIRGLSGYVPGMNPINGERAFYWVRVAESATLDKIGHYALLTLASDFWYTLPVHGLSDEDRPSFITTSLDHAIWFHNRPDFSQWTLVETQGVLAENDIGFKRASFWSRCGRPIATVMQQALIRGTTKN